MKQLFLSLTLLLLGASLSFAQIKTPAASPSSTIEQQVGLTNITVEYSRPGMKGRTIFAQDGLVPFGKVWRTGANQATKVTFDQDVTVGSAKLKKGSYAILTKPSANAWEVMFYPYESGNWGSYVEKTPAGMTKAEVKKTDWKTESFTIGFNDLNNNGATMAFMWDNVYVPVKVMTNTDEMAMASIERALAGPSARDYYLAGSYMHDSKKDLNQAYNYVHKANEMDAKFWQLRREALILADMGKTKEAIATAKRSMEMAQEAGNEDYVRMNKKSIEEWSMGGKTGSAAPSVRKKKESVARPTLQEVRQ